MELRLGGDWRQTEGETKERFSAGTRGRLAGGRTSTLGAYAEAAVERGPLTLTGGGRIDRWWISDGFLNERIFATGVVLTDTSFQNRSGWQPTARAGIAYRPDEVLTLRSAAYLGWRLPTLNELYRPFRVGADATAANSDLDPERLRGIEAGAEYRPLANVRIGLTAFANRLTDGIANVTLGRGPGTFPGVGFVGAGGEYRMRRNIDAIDVRGVELDARLDLASWTLSGGYSYADAEVRASGAAAPLNGLRPAQTPRHSFSSSLSWRYGNGARASLAARYTGSQFEDDLNAQILPHALTFDATASIPISTTLKLEARAENFTDERIVAGISGAGIVERATPRTLWIGLRYGR
jgi:outer membrane receptor protein involved in Fe transport